jgi:osmotically-inducible protein OsmY
MNDDELREKIVAVLAGLRADTSGVSVQAERGAVVLGGEVRSWFDQDEIERAVWAVPGVSDVENLIVYRDGDSTAEAEGLP